MDELFLDLLCRYREDASRQDNTTPTKRAVLCGQSKRGAVYNLDSFSSEVMGMLSLVLSAAVYSVDKWLYGCVCVCDPCTSELKEAG